MARLAERHTLIAPDLRGFGDSDKPAGPWGNAEHAADMLGLLDALGLEQVGVVGHDVGGGVMQAMAREQPQRFAGLFFFDFVYPGIGWRMGAPDRLAEIWYQSFHLLEMAPPLVGASRAGCRAYIGHFLRHWSPALPPIAIPTCVRWAANDPIFPATWTNRLGETFTDLDLDIMPAIGHFPHREDPDRAVAEIAAFFSRIGWGGS